MLETVAASPRSPRRRGASRPGCCWRNPSVCSAIRRRREAVTELRGRSTATWPYSSRNSASSRRGSLPRKATSAGPYRALWKRPIWPRLPVNGRVEMFALHDACQFGDLTSLQRLVDVAQNIGGRSLSSMPYTRPPCGIDATGLSFAAAQFEDIGALLSAADAAAQAAALFRTADDRRQAVTPPPPPIGSQRPAGACTRRLWRLRHNHCRSARANANRQLRLAGLCNRDIADRLVVSTRTVEGHIYRACIKLDVTDREGLAMVVRRGRGN